MDAPALTYAEVKAIASGNPLVIEKAKVDAEVMRLSRLRAEHDEAQFNTRMRVRMLEQDVTRTERQIAGMERDLTVRQDTRGEKFRIMLHGIEVTERPKAGEMLIHLVDRHLRASAPVVLGELAGFKIEFRPSLPDTLTLQGVLHYSAKVSPSPIGIISSLEHAARSIEENLAARRTDLVQAKKNLTDLSALIGRPFEHDARHRELQTRQAELVQSLDLTKNQAPSEFGTDSTETMVPPAPAENQAAAESAAVAAEPDCRIAV
jgi:hypothetical protein